MAHEGLAAVAVAVAVAVATAATPAIAQDCPVVHLAMVVGCLVSRAMADLEED